MDACTEKVKYLPEAGIARTQGVELHLLYVEEGAAALVGPLEKSLGTKSGVVSAGQSWVVLQIP